MTISLTPELERLLQARMKTGRYGSENDVLREALELLDHHDEVLASRQDEIRDQIEEGWQSAKRGELVSGKEVFERIDEELKALEKAAGK
jgi:antitoxin ParD1/3/4